MLKREKTWSIAGALVLAVALTITLPACERDRDVAVDRVDPVVTPAPPGTVATQPDPQPPAGTTPGLTIPGPTPTSPPADTATVTPPDTTIPPGDAALSPADDELRIGAELPEPDELGTEPDTGLDMTRTDPDALGERENTVEVTLTEFDIEMPTVLTAGEITFNISNEGDAPHSFEIEGEGIEEALYDPLSAGQTASLRVELLPGTYRIYCPVADHEDHGMELEITVEESPGRQTAAMQ
jgi:plastocyanin